MGHGRVVAEIQAWRGKPQLLLSTATQPEADEPGWRFPAGHSESFPRGRCPCGLVDSVGLSSSAGG